MAQANDRTAGTHVEVLEPGKECRDLGGPPAVRIAHIVMRRRGRHDIEVALPAGCGRCVRHAVSRKCADAVTACPRSLPRPMRLGALPALRTGNDAPCFRLCNGCTGTRIAAIG